jgi:hypothetical protein
MTVFGRLDLAGHCTRIRAETHPPGEGRPRVPPARTAVSPDPVALMVSPAIGSGARGIVGRRQPDDAPVRSIHATPMPTWASWTN